ncbi:HNH homing endonuclease [Bacillus phage Stahl]|uniref:HNH homing endonuclease n=1 Tax=Bacillus phage Stahl TaxID=1610832 RepID=A0A0E3M3F2_9CAUD|nr:HNH endonuclease [Bacillus phage Stahl]AKA61531.1 HNH homing endonuclease [Bacillus phage Stahl]
MIMKNNYKVKGEDIEIYVQSIHGEFTVIMDVSFLNTLEQISSISIRQSSKKEDYFTAVFYHEGEVVFLHHLVSGKPLNDLVVDHIDRNPLNNKSNNLRVVTKSFNSINKSACNNSKSGIRGVYWCKTNKKWRCEATYEGKRHRLGRYSTLVEARRVIRKFWEEKGIVI